MELTCYSDISEDMEMMKERFAKLLLGEDMSGGGKGVSSALALSNAITNLAGNFISLCCSYLLKISNMSIFLIICIDPTFNFFYFSVYQKTQFSVQLTIK